MKDMSYNEILETVLPEYTLLQTAENGIDQGSCCLLQGEGELAALAAAGVQPNRIYADTRWLPEAQIRGIFGKCRFVAGSLEELRFINRIALSENSGGQLTAVGLHLVPAAYDGGRQGIKEAELPALASEIKKLSAVSVQGCFVQGCIDGLCGKELGRYFRDCYELAKRMTVILPCSMPYLCVAGAVDAVVRNGRDQPETLSEVRRAAEIVAMQNSTAFYAKLLIT